jgi:2-keto-4-pentenoate hydratase/2-oxohepta-3-ene-1,7-dioic acid hydratase in catechol pathway
MKLLRYGPAGEERPGLLDSTGRLRSLWPAISDLTPDVISPAGLKIIAALDPEKLPLVEGKPRLGVPVAGIRQFFAIGLNYSDHVEESGLATPTEPMLFNKALTSLAGPDDDVLLPRGSAASDWEVELAVFIGTEASNVDEARALDHVAGYALANDLSERDWQSKRGGQFVKGKSAPTFGPIGPYLVTTDEIPDPQRIDLRLDVNGITRQNGTTAKMIFGVREIVAHVSQVLTLLPGDVIVTGTPAGVGLGMKPPLFLKAGDVIDISSPQLGTQRQRVLAAE